MPLDELAIPESDKELLTTKQLSAELRVHPDTIYRWQKAGTGPPFVCLGEGRDLYRYRRPDVRAWLNNRTSQRHASPADEP
jgi:predicted DNA-binding transcriptional regulator AlpA